MAEWTYFEDFDTYRLVLTREEMGFLDTVFFAGLALLEPDQWVMSLGQRAIKMQLDKLGEEKISAITSIMEIINTHRTGDRSNV